MGKIEESNCRVRDVQVKSLTLKVIQHQHVNQQFPISFPELQLGYEKKVSRIRRQILKHPIHSKKKKLKHVLQKPSKFS